MCQVGVRVEPCQVVRAVSLTTAPIPRLARRGCCPCKWPSCSRQGRTTSLYNSRCFDNPPLAEALRQPFFDAPRAPCRVLLVGAAVMLRRLCRRPHWLLLVLVVVVVVVVLLLLLLLLPLLLSSLPAYRRRLVSYCETLPSACTAPGTDLR